MRYEPQRSFDHDRYSPLKQYFSKQSNLFWNNGWFECSAIIRTTNEKFIAKFKNVHAFVFCQNKNLQYNNIKLLFPERIILSWYLTRIRKGQPSFQQKVARRL